jgi:hypothetical protein
VRCWIIPLLPVISYPNSHSTGTVLLRVPFVNENGSACSFVFHWLVVVNIVLPTQFRHILNRKEVNFVSRFLLFNVSLTRISSRIKQINKI